MVKDKSYASRIVDILIYSTLFFYSIVTLLPFLYVAVKSFSVTNEIIPTKFGLDAYRFIFSTSAFLKSLGNSVYITLLGTAISLLVTSLMAYSLSNKQLVGRRLIMFIVIFTMMFNGGMIPTYFVVKQTGLLNSLWSLMIPTAVNAFNLIVLKNFFQNIPEELKESAVIDGCHELLILFRIILPLSLPALAAFGLFYAVAKWNIYFQALLYIHDPEKWPVQVLLRQVIFISTGAIGDSLSADVNLTFSSEGIRSAVIIVATFPILLVYPFLQKHFTKGILLGSVKG